MASEEFNRTRQTYIVEIVLYDNVVIHTARVVGMGMTELSRKLDAQRQARKLLNNISYRLRERP